MNGEEQVRRLRAEEQAAARRLFAQQGRDAAWMGAERLAFAQLWGAFSAEGLATCAAVFSARGPAMQAQALALAWLPHTQRLVLPAGAAAMPRAAVLLRVCGGGSFTAAVPVKTGGAWLRPCFAAGMQLAALWPLHALRPHYLFVSKRVQTVGKSCIIVPVKEPLRLSRALACGWVGTALCARGVVLKRRVEPQ